MGDNIMDSGVGNYEILSNMNFDKLVVPDECPICHHAIEPQFIIGYQFQTLMYYQLRIVFACPRKKCLEIFFSIYSKNSIEIFDRSPPSYIGSSPYKYMADEFEERINTVSPNFVTIYNQAKQAEERKLDQICGLGYRKALEFLIKDYLIVKFPEDAESIKNNHRFDSVIEKYVTDEKIKFIARSASWLGNDHAHYTRRWEDMDINDLKTLINSSLYWISAELEFEHYKEQMKDGRKN
jgi:hypothetical protein